MTAVAVAPAINREMIGQINRPSDRGLIPAYRTYRGCLAAGARCPQAVERSRKKLPLCDFVQRDIVLT
jgi:hypothetical protein